MLPSDLHQALHAGMVIPASPLALDARRKLDERRQRALWRYYAAAGAGGIAIGVHTTQFAIRDPAVGLFEPLLNLAADELDRLDAARPLALLRVGGICARTPQAMREAELLWQHGFHAGLLSLSALREATEDQLIEHCRAIAGVIPVVGFYLQPAVGGRRLTFRFWRRFAEIENVIAIKIAPFNRYQTLDVMRAVAESGRQDIALYTGNDDNILLDLVTPYRISVNGAEIERRIVGGLLGHWSVWTQKAVEQLRLCRRGEAALAQVVALSQQVTDANAAFFDSANGFAGCIAGLHEVLRRQGLLEGIWLLDENEILSPGQREEIDRVCAAYPHLCDDAFVAQNRDEWLQM